MQFYREFEDSYTVHGYWGFVVLTIRRYPMTFFRTWVWASFGYLPAAIIGGFNTGWARPWVIAQTSIGIMLLVLLVFISLSEARIRWKLLTKNKQPLH